MACRKDGKGRVLRKGEHYRKTDGRYSYIYTDPLGKQRTIYAKSLVTLRQKEDELLYKMHAPQNTFFPNLCQLHHSHLNLPLFYMILLIAIAYSTFLN